MPEVVRMGVGGASRSGASCARAVVVSSSSSDTQQTGNHVDRGWTPETGRETAERHRESEREGRRLRERDVPHREVSSARRRPPPPAPMPTRQQHQEQTGECAFVSRPCAGVAVALAHRFHQHRVACGLRHLLVERREEIVHYAEVKLTARPQPHLPSSTHTRTDTHTRAARG